MEFLLVEPDLGLAGYIRKKFEQAGHVVKHVVCGREALIASTKNSVSSIAVSDSVDDVSIENIEKAFSLQKDPPVTFLYKKPFLADELLNIAENRKAKLKSKHKVTCGDLEMVHYGQFFNLHGERLELTKREYDLLSYLIRHKEMAVTIQALHRAVFSSMGTEKNVLSVLYRIRAKTRMIRTLGHNRYMLSSTLGRSDSDKV